MFMDFLSIFIPIRNDGERIPLKPQISILIAFQTQKMSEPPLLTNGESPLGYQSTKILPLKVFVFVPFLLQTCG